METPEHTPDYTEPRSHTKENILLVNAAPKLLEAARIGQVTRLGIANFIDILKKYLSGDAPNDTPGVALHIIGEIENSLGHWGRVSNAAIHKATKEE